MDGETETGLEGLMTEAATNREPQVEAARRFFLERIEREAAQEGKPLSDAEREFLGRMACVEGKEYDKLEKAAGGDDAVASLSERGAELLGRCLRNESLADPSIVDVYKAKLEQIGEEDLLLGFMVAWVVEPKAAKTLGYTLYVSFAALGVVLISVILFLVIKLVFHR